MYDLTNPQSYDNLTRWKESFLAKSMVMMPESFPFMVVGNKVDLEEENRQVNEKQAKKFCQENGKMLFIETSAKDNYNVEKAFVSLAKQAIERQALVSKKVDDIQSSDRARDRLKKSQLSRVQHQQMNQKKKKNDCNC